MLLGRPWLKQAKVKQDWGENRVVIKKGKHSIIVLMNGKKEMVVQEKPLFAQTINLADAVEDDEEEDFLKANPTVVPVFEVDVKAIINKEEEPASSNLVPGQEVQGAEVI